MISLPFFAAGAASWSLTEYCLHRFAGHGPRRGPPKGLEWVTPTGVGAAFQQEHVAHHVTPTYFAASWKKAATAALAVPVVGGAVSLVAGPRRGVSYALGFASAYLAYEVIHRRVHTDAPIGAYSRWVDKNHLHHHVNPRKNHGVTSPVWDLVFGTHESVSQKVKLPARMAPAWMTDEQGVLREEFAHDYELTGAPRPRTAAVASA